MSEIVHRCMTKATMAEGDDIRRSLSWVFARRNILQVTTDSLICGDWVVPYADIDEAILFRLKGALFPGYVLRIKAGPSIYQFGLNAGRFWKGELPFPCQRDSARIGYSWFSTLVRIALMAAILYAIWKRFQ